MKIYSKVVIDIESGGVLESESFDYEGPLALANLGGNPLAALSGGPAQTALAAIPGLGPVMTALQIAKGANDVFGPQGALVKGDPSALMSGAQSIYGGYQGLTGGGAAPQAPTLQSTLGINKSQFDQLPPDIAQELLRKISGR